MLSTLINGRAIADEVLGGVTEQVMALGAPLHLAAVCVGDDTGLRAFVNLKKKAAQSVGIEFSSYFFDAGDEAGARSTLEFLAGDETVDGIFIELPLPEQWDAGALVALIPPQKDVDVLTAAMRGAFDRGDDGAVMPPAVRALQYVVDAHAIVLAGARVAIVGMGQLVGAPIAQWLERIGARVDRIDVNTPSPVEISLHADIVIAAAGVPGLVTADWIREGATVIDFGYGRKGDAYVGDVDIETVQKKAGLVTPVPGGMGPLVIAAVLENVVLAGTR